MGFFGRKKRLSFYDNEVQQHIVGKLGKCVHLFEPPNPFHVGHKGGGGATIHLYVHPADGTIYMTGDLIGQKQKKSDAGNYELMIAQKGHKETWGALLISKLAYYTLAASIQPLETMELEGGPFASDKYSVRHLLFHLYDSFEIEKQKLGLLLIIGITQEEWEWGRTNGNEQLLEKLKEKNIYPFTDLYRQSIV